MGEQFNEEKPIGESLDFYKARWETCKKEAEDYFEKIIKERFPYITYERGQEEYSLANLTPAELAEYFRLKKISGRCP